MRLEAVVYEHAAALLGRVPWDVSRDAELLFAGHAAALERYAAGAAVAGIDVYNLEPEAYGAAAQPPSGHEVPALAGPILGDAAALLQLPAIDVGRGRLPMTLAVGRRLARAFPGVEVMAPVCGPLTLAAQLAGLEAALTEAVLEPGAMADRLRHVEEATAPYLHAVAEAGLRPVVFESAAAPPMLSPELFARVVGPALRQRLGRITTLDGRGAVLVIGGDTLPLLPALADMAPARLIAPAETDQPAFVAALAAYPAIECRVNMRPGVFTAGDDRAVAAELERVTRAAAGRPRTWLGTGVLPYDAQPALVTSALRAAAGGAGHLP